MKKESAFIKECFIAYLGNPDYKKIRRLFNSINESKLDILIQKHQLGGLFYYLYKSNHFEEISFSASLLNNWKITSWNNTFKNSLNDAECMRILKSLDNANINYTYIKGAVCRKYYENDYIRASVDIDIFINQNDYELVKEILLKSDYTIPIKYYKNLGMEIDFSEYEKFINEIAFTKKYGNNKYIIDLQWDFIGFEKNSLFHNLYPINILFLSNNTDKMNLNGYLAKTLTPDKELYIMAFHYAFHHAFRGLKWFLDICTYIKDSGMSFEEMTSGLSENGKKIIGIVTLLANDFMGKSTLSKETKKILHIDKVTKKEYLFYKSMLFKTHEGVYASISSRLIKAMLAYQTKDKIRILNYLLFNSSSIHHRLSSDKKYHRLLHPFSLLKIAILDFFRHRKRSHEKFD